MSLIARLGVLAGVVLLPLALAALVRRDRETLVRVGTLVVLFGALWGIAWGGTWAVACFAAALCLGGLLELARLPGARWVSAAAPLGVAAVLAGPLAPPDAAIPAVATASVALAAGLAISLARPGVPGRAVVASLALYVVAGTAAMPLLDARRSALFLASVLLLQFNDGFAYVAGRLFGRRKLAPVISPNKSVEGALGGALGVLALAVLLGSPALPVLQGVAWPWMALLVVLVVVPGIGGDLLFSLVKRRAGIKDYSGLLPGHGGVLDRSDSAVATLPLLAAWALVAW